MTPASALRKDANRASLLVSPSRDMLAPPSGQRGTPYAPVAPLNTRPGGDPQAPRHLGRIRLRIAHSRHRHQQHRARHLAWAAANRIPLTVLALPLARKLIAFQTQAVPFHEALPVCNALEVGGPAFLIGWRRIGPFWAPLEGIIEAGGVIWRDVLLFVRPRTAPPDGGWVALKLFDARCYLVPVDCHAPAPA